MALCSAAGFNFATAFEIALKAKELAYVAVEPYSSADFQHGPIALIDTGFAAIVVNVTGAVSAEVEDLLRTIVARGARPVVLSNQPASLALAAAPIPLAGDMPEWLSPIAAIVPGQLLAFHLSRPAGSIRISRAACRRSRRRRDGPRQYPRARRSRHPLAGGPQDEPRRPIANLQQERLGFGRPHLAPFPQQPAQSFLDHVVVVGGERARDARRLGGEEPAAHAVNQARRPPPGGATGRATRAHRHTGRAARRVVRHQRAQQAHRERVVIGPRRHAIEPPLEAPELGVAEPPQ